MSRKAIMLVGVLLLFTLGAIAQEQRSEISLQGTGFFTKDSSGDGLSQTATDAGGFLTGYALVSIGGSLPRLTKVLAEIRSSISRP